MCVCVCVFMGGGGDTVTSVLSGVTAGSLISVTCPRIDYKCDSRGDPACVCEAGGEKRVDVGVRE